MRFKVGATHSRDYYLFKKTEDNDEEKRQMLALICCYLLRVI
jgi:hypothetical protein